MKKITRTGVGTADSGTRIIHAGAGVLPVQANVDGVASFRLLGRVANDAPWVEIRAPSSEGYLEACAWVPEMRLEVVSGNGTVTIWIGEA